MRALEGPPKNLDVEALATPPKELQPEPVWDPDIAAPLIPRYMPAGRFHLLGASPQTGKSTIIAQLASALTTGEDFLGLPVNKKQVRFLFTDRCLESNYASLDRAGVLHLPTIGLVNTPELLEFEAKSVRMALGPYKYLERCFDYMEVKPGDVIISDVHTNAFCGDIFNHSRMGAIMRFTGALCLTRKVTLIGTGYGLKITNDAASMYMRLCDRIIGAAPLRGSADTLMYLTHPDEFCKGGVVQRFEISSRLAPLWKIDLINKGGILVPETLGEAAQRVQTQKETEDAKKTPACYKVLPYVPFEDTAFKDICMEFATKTGKVAAQGTINGWLSDLEKHGAVVSVRHGVWRRRES